MARYFDVMVNHMSVSVQEVFSEPKKYDWSCVIAGETIKYSVRKAVKSGVKNWFERGTSELQYHAYTIANGMPIFWQHRTKHPKQESGKTKAIRDKMEKLL